PGDLRGGRRRGSAGRERPPRALGAAPRRPRHRLRSGRARRAHLPACPGRREDGRAMSTIELRRLRMRDLSAIEGIERRSYPTPWSRSMFAGELAKPSSICLGAFDPESDALLGYLIISRYVDAWHVMNVAVAP